MDYIKHSSVCGNDDVEAVILLARINVTISSVIWRPLKGGREAAFSIKMNRIIYASSTQFRKIK
jgi:hypothetical protein